MFSFVNANKVAAVKLLSYEVVIRIGHVSEQIILITQLQRYQVLKCPENAEFIIYAP